GRRVPGAVPDPSHARGDGGRGPGGRHPGDGRLGPGTGRARRVRSLRRGGVVIRSARVIVGGALYTPIYASRAVFASWRNARDLPCQCDEYARRWSEAILRLAGARVRLE